MSFPGKTYYLCSGNYGTIKSAARKATALLTAGATMLSVASALNFSEVKKNKEFYKTFDVGNCERVVVEEKTYSACQLTNKKFVYSPETFEVTDLGVQRPWLILDKDKIMLGRGTNIKASLTARYSVADASFYRDIKAREEKYRYIVDNAFVPEIVLSITQPLAQFWFALLGKQIGGIALSGINMADAGDSIAAKVGRKTAKKVVVDKIMDTLQDHVEKIVLDSPTRSSSVTSADSFRDAMYDIIWEYANQLRAVHKESFTMKWPRKYGEVKRHVSDLVEAETKARAALMALNKYYGEDGFNSAVNFAIEQIVRPAVEGVVGLNAGSLRASKVVKKSFIKNVLQKYPAALEVFKEAAQNNELFEECYGEKGVEKGVDFLLAELEKYRTDVSTTKTGAKTAAAPKDDLDKKKDKVIKAIEDYLDSLKEDSVAAEPDEEYSDENISVFPSEMQAAFNRTAEQNSAELASTQSQAAAQKPEIPTVKVVELPVQKESIKAYSKSLDPSAQDSALPYPSIDLRVNRNHINLGASKDCPDIILNYISNRDAEVDLFAEMSINGSGRTSEKLRSGEHIRAGTLYSLKPGTCTPELMSAINDAEKTMRDIAKKLDKGFAGISVGVKYGIRATAGGQMVEDSETLTITTK